MITAASTNVYDVVIWLGCTTLVCFTVLLLTNKLWTSK